MNNEHDIFNTLKTKTLSPSERVHMRAHLDAYRAAHPVSNTSATTGRVRSPFNLFDFSRPLPAFASLLILVLSSGGVVYAGEGAVPGDLLYGVKVNVTEPVRVALAKDEGVRADLEAWRALRRLEEAQTLAVRDSLSFERKERLEENFDAHATRVEERVERIAESDPVQAYELAGRFEASLAAHAAILASLDTDDTEDVVDRINSRLTRIVEKRALATLSFADTTSSASADNTVEMSSARSLKSAAPVEVSSFSLMQAREVADAPALENTSAGVAVTPPNPTLEKAVERARERAENIIKNATELYEENEKSLSSRDRERVVNQIARAHTSFEAGETLYEQGRNREALSEFERVLYAMEALSVFLTYDTSKTSPPVRERVLELVEINERDGD